MTTKTKKRAPRAKPTHAPRRSPVADRYERFANEYLIDHNATQAAIRAGYSAHTAEQQGPRLLGNLQVRAILAEKAAKLADRYEISHDRIKRELALMGFANMYDFISMDSKGRPDLDLSELTRDQAAAIQSIDFDKGKIRLADKRAALNDLAKITGLLSDTPEVTIPVRFVIERTKPGRPIPE